MRDRILLSCFCAAVHLLSSAILSAQERWLYRFNGPGDADEAYSVAMGPDGNLYVGGTGVGSGSSTDFIVVSLTPLGAERWVYRYNGPGNYMDETRSIAIGPDSAVYAAGYSYRSEPSFDYDFTVVSCDPSGAERWVYRYDGPANSGDLAYAVATGPDSNVYAAGYSWGSGTAETDFTVTSLTRSGSERWVYRYDGPGNNYDFAKSVAISTDSNLYVAGYSCGLAGFDFTVISLTPLGAERWVYNYHGSANAYDEALSIAAGPDGAVYAAGITTWTATDEDFTVISLDASGAERWVYRYNGAANWDDGAGSIVVGTDGNIYAAGISEASGTYADFVAISLTSSGVERWVYRSSGPGQSADSAASIVVGLDGNVYITGRIYGSGTSADFSVVSLTQSGAERWVYRYNGPADLWDEGRSVAIGSDGNLYVAGWCSVSLFRTDFTVISLFPDVGVGEAREAGARKQEAGLLQNSPSRFTGSTTIQFSIPGDGQLTCQRINLSVYDLSGRLVAALVDEKLPAGTHSVTWAAEATAPGVYFARLRAAEVVATRKMVLLR